VSVVEQPLVAPFPYFGGKRDVVTQVWARFGRPKHYIEPFCGSAAMLLGAPRPAALEVIGDANGFIANFWRAVVNQHAEVARWADYPVVNVDLGARHVWLMAQRERLGAALQDPEWPGDAQVAGWWMWGQCCWIGSGWADWWRTRPMGDAVEGGQIPFLSSPGMGVQAGGKIPHVNNLGRGVQAVGQIPQINDVGRGYASKTHIAEDGAGPDHWTSSGAVAAQWLRRLAARLNRVRVVHGAWDRCLNSYYGKEETAVFLDPPYDGYEDLYRADSVVAGVIAWCREHGDLRVALCGHLGDYDLPGWDCVGWERLRTTYGSSKTKDQEAIWYSPGCLPAEPRQRALWEGF
jgi:hypothetical protein